MSATVFQPRASSALPFLTVILIVFCLGGYGVLRSMRERGGEYSWALASVVVLAAVIGYMAVQARRKAEPITVYHDRIRTPSWSIPFEEIRMVRDDRISATQYVGGRPVVSTQRRLVVDTDGGAKAVAYEATFDIDAMKVALDAALSAFRQR
jgi:hypothetical protein